jgi:ACS family hexuronate transporter-like MFS transporter
MKDPRLRWVIVGLVFLVTLINYIDRLTISVLAPVITKDLGLSNLQFGSIATWFLLAYTVSQALSGRLYDRIGTRLGFTVSVTIWSLAAMATAAARSFFSLSIFRFILGLGEAGNWPGAAKAIAEWFPVRERAFGMAIFNSGAALGAVVAPPLIVYLQLHYGWQSTFLLTGALGLLWLPLWLSAYPLTRPSATLSPQAGRGVSRDPSPRLAGRGWRAAPGEGPTFSTLLHHRQVWGIVIARFITDPTWWLYITWLPKYLNDARGFSLAKIGLFAWIPYLAADIGSLSGGWLSGHLIARGWSVDRARKAVILGAALLMPAGILAVRADRAMTALALMCVVLFAFQVWINNVQTLPSDFFPQIEVASVAGLGGVGAGIGSMIFIFGTGWVVDHFSYTPVFTVAGFLGPIGTLLLFLLSGRITPVQRMSEVPA